MHDADKLKWDTPVQRGKWQESAEKHEISPDRAQMLISPLGHGLEQLEAAAAAVDVKQRST